MLDIFLLFLSKYKDAVIRMVVILGGLYGVFWVLKPKWLEKYRIHAPKNQQPKVLKEMAYTFTTYLVFTLFSTLVLIIYKTTGYIQMYTDVAQYGWFYTIASFFIFVVYSDTTFYWSHVFMHKWKLLNQSHARHHQFVNVTPWAAYAFHAGEAFINAGSFFLLMLIFPWHPIVLLSYVVFSIFYNGMIHSGYDLFPKSWRSNPVLKWLNTPTHHILHHHGQKHNYGFILTFWDKVMKTEKL